jgi:alkanesulfonate monooxygenase SsuD/methylene tetrahydromethanopterin reductase-like flavin-dependent oxidoreductase (luciferase family)
MATGSPSLQQAPRVKTRLGFNASVSFGERTVGPACGLHDGVELFKAAEKLGYHSGWAYQQHFDHYLSSPVPFFAAVGQNTGRIALGSTVTPMRYQDPILLAEEAGTADRLTDGRLQLAFNNGADSWDAVFGTARTDARTEGQRHLARFLTGVPGQRIPARLTVTSHRPGLRDRIWYGSRNVTSAVQAAQLGLRLITGTTFHEVTDESFPEYQARLIGEYRAAWKTAHGTDAPPVAVTASVLPGTTPKLREKYAAYDLQRAAASQQALSAELSASILTSPLYHGDPDAVTDAVLADPGLSAADELVLLLPPAFGLEENVRLLTDLAQTIAPALGWTPAA